MDSPSVFECISLRICPIRSSSAALLPVDTVSKDFFFGRFGEPTGVTNSSGEVMSASASGTSLMVS